MLRRGSLPPAPLGLPLQLSYRVLMCYATLVCSSQLCHAVLVWRVVCQSKMATWTMQAA